MVTLDQLKVFELKTELEERDLETSGTKTILKKRLYDFVLNNGEDPSAAIFETKKSRVLEAVRIMIEEFCANTSKSLEWPAADAVQEDGGPVEIAGAKRDLLGLGVTVDARFSLAADALTRSGEQILDRDARAGEELRADGGLLDREGAAKAGCNDDSSFRVEGDALASEELRADGGLVSGRLLDRESAAKAGGNDDSSYRVEGDARAGEELRMDEELVSERLLDREGAVKTGRSLGGGDDRRRSASAEMVWRIRRPEDRGSGSCEQRLGGRRRVFRDAAGLRGRRAQNIRGPGVLRGIGPQIRRVKGGDRRKLCRCWRQEVRARRRRRRRPSGGAGKIDRRRLSGGAGGSDRNKRQSGQERKFHQCQRQEIRARRRWRRPIENVGASDQDKRRPVRARLGSIRRAVFRGGGRRRSRRRKHRPRRVVRRQHAEELRADDRSSTGMKNRDGVADFRGNESRNSHRIQEEIWRIVRSMMEIIFEGTGVTILVCHYDPRNSLEVKKQVDCHFFQSTGCTKGATCQFRHEPRRKLDNVSGRNMSKEGAM